MRFAVLGSGSSGNALVVESGGRRLLVDAGFSRRQIETRFRSIAGEEPEEGGEPEDPRYVPDIRFDAMLLTHEHRDHVAGAEVLARRRGVEVWATRGTLDHLRLSDEARRSSHVIRSGTPFEVAGFEVEAFAVPHDAREPVGFVIEDSTGRRLALVADLGARSRLAWAKLRDLDVLVLETNHDLHMLRTGPYPWSLKQRVASRHGHLSNEDAAHGVREALADTGDRLRTLVCYHLSRTNNDPELAAAAVGEVLDREGCGAEVVLTRQDGPTPWFVVPEPKVRAAKDSVEPARQLALFA